MKRHTQFAVVLGLLAAGAATFLTGLGWGLPSRDVDPYLFGAHPVWSGREILALAGPYAAGPERVADLSASPLDNRERAVIVNATDEQRARIVRRYRLMSYHPDEFVTFAALALMNPSRYKFDPRMYKYGGLWIYPVGVMLKAAGIAGLVQLKSDIAWYFDRPEFFGRFYIVARLYSALWGLLGIVVVFILVHRITGSVSAAGIGGLCFLLMPVVVNAAHEAKPHLAGVVLMLLGILPAVQYAQHGHRRAWFATAILSGMAVGMVPSSLPILVVLPVMEYIRGKWGTRIVSVIRSAFRVVEALVVVILVYSITNPYIPVNLIRDPAVLRSSFQNTRRFYQATWAGAGVPNALLLVGLGTSFVLALAGGAGAVALTTRAVAVTGTINAQMMRARVTSLLLAVSALVVVVQFTLFAAGQQADYARFAIFFDIYLAITAVVMVETFVRPRAVRVLCFTLLVLTTGWMGGLCVRAFLDDSSSRPNRMLVASRLEELLARGDRVLATRLEPAPWSLPPVDLWRWTLVVPPGGLPQDAPFDGAQITVGPIDLPPGAQSVVLKLLLSTPISWASKPFKIQTPERRDDQAGDKVRWHWRTAGHDYRDERAEGLGAFWNPFQGGWETLFRLPRLRRAPERSSYPQATKHSKQ